MLAPSEAIEKARSYLSEVVPDYAALEPTVEEIVRVKSDSGEGEQWRVSFVAIKEESGKSKTLADLLRWRKIQKIVSVGADDGSLVSVRNPDAFEQHAAV